MKILIPLLLLFSSQPQLNLVPCFTPVASPESNGMSEVFVKTLKRDSLRVSPCPTPRPRLTKSPDGSTTTTSTILIPG